MNPKTIRVLKIAILILLNAVAAFYLSEFMRILVDRQIFFNLDLWYVFKVILLMTVQLYCFSLTVGFWNKWEQYAFVALPIVLGITASLIRIDIFYGVLSGVLLFGLLAYDIYKADIVYKLLTKFKPAMILKITTTGLMFIFSLVSGIMVILTSPNLPKVDLGKQIAGFIEPQLKQVISDEFQKKTTSLLPALNQQELQKLDPSIRQAYTSVSAQAPSFFKQYLIDLNVAKIAEIQINNFLAPYRDFLNPLFALLMYMQFNFYAMFAKMLYGATIDFVYWIAKQTGLLKTTYVTVEKEKLTI